MDWLKELKVGDVVGVRRYGAARPGKVTEIEERGIWALDDCGGTLFDWRGFGLTGDLAHRSQLTEWTPELAGDFRGRMLVENLQSTPWHTLPLTTLEQITALLEATPDE